MPVENHQVHPSTKVGPEHRYGCFDHVRENGYWALNGRGQLSDRPIITWVENAMSKECRHDHSLTDPHCSGCQHAGSGEAYSLSVVNASK